jgi:pilus assembly protein CpaE
MIDRILLISSDAALIRMVKSALALADSLLQIDELAEHDERIGKQFQPSAVIVDSDARCGIKTAFERIVDARRQFPSVPVIAMGNEMSTQLVLAALRAGASDFIDREAGVEQMQLSLQTCLSNNASAQRHSRSRVAAVLSSSPNEHDQDFALNLAVRAARRDPGEMVLYIDLSLPASQAGIALALDLKLGVSDAIREISRLDRALLENAVACDKRSGLYVMALSGDYRMEDHALETESFSALLQILQSVFDVIVIGLGPFSRQQALLQAVRPAARLFLCCNQRFSSVRGAGEFLRWLGEHNMTDITDVVVHELATGQIPAPADIRKVLQIPGSIDVGGSWSHLAEHFNDAAPIALDARSRYCRALDTCLARMGLAVAAEPNIAARLLGWLRPGGEVRAS